MYKINLSDERYKNLDGPAEIENLAKFIINYLILEEKEEFKRELTIALVLESAEDKEIKSEALLKAIKNEIMQHIDEKMQIKISPVYLDPKDFYVYRAVSVKYICNDKPLIVSTDNNLKFEIHNTEKFETKILNEDNLEELAEYIAHTYLAYRDTNKKSILKFPYDISNKVFKLYNAIRTKLDESLVSEGLHAIIDVNANSIEFILMP